MSTRLFSSVLLALLAATCTTGSGGSGEPRRNRNVLTSEELAPLENFTAWDAVQRLRPMWMRPGGIRNSANPTGHYPTVFVDGSPYGEMESLQTFRVISIEEMRYVSGSDATIRYGGDYQGGVILITTRSREELSLPRPTGGSPGGSVPGPLPASLFPPSPRG